jgi:AraC-like DNA-binding protein
LEKKQDTLYLWNGKILFVGQGNYTSFHSHTAASILISFDDDFHLEWENKKMDCRFCVIPPHFYHRSESKNCKLIAIQLDPDSLEYGFIKHLIKSNEPALFHIESTEHIISIWEDAMFGRLSCFEAVDCVSYILFIIGGEKYIKHKIDFRIMRIIKYLKNNFTEENIPVEELARIAEISPDRFMHLFKENMGLPTRRYILWLKLNQAGRLLKSGKSLTDAAIEAGFSDSAHFSRIFRENFGLKPSEIFSKNSVRLFFCE